MTKPSLKEVANQSHTVKMWEAQIQTASLLITIIYNHHAACYINNNNKKKIKGKKIHYFFSFSLSSTGFKMEVYCTPLQLFPEWKF